MVIPKGTRSIKVIQKDLPFIPFDVNFQRGEDKPVDNEELVMCVGQTD